MLDFQVDFADRIAAERRTADLIILTDDLDTGDLLDRPKGGIDRPIALFHRLCLLLVAVPEGQADVRRLIAGTGHLVIDERPLRVDRGADLLLDQGDDVTVIDLLFLVSQLLEPFKHLLQLFALSV